MTTEEFSNSMDTMLNSYASQAAFGEGASRADIVLDEYEKSVILTQAQDLVVKSRYPGNTEVGFDNNSRVQVDFSTLVEYYESSTPVEGTNTLDDRGVVFEMPHKALVIFNERVIGYTKSTVDGDTVTPLNPKPYVVVPISYKEYDRKMSVAYTQPLKKQCWRLIINNNINDSTGERIGNDVSQRIEIIPISGVNIQTYKARYLRRPRPIVLADLSADGLAIDGYSSVTECELDPTLHMEILQKAVEIVLSTRGRTQAQPAKE